jgi:hypothetical protein
MKTTTKLSKTDIQVKKENKNSQTRKTSTKTSKSDQKEKPDNENNNKNQ